MYFLVKSVRTCARPLKGSPNNLKLYKNGILDRECFARNMSYFFNHPEQLRQKLKEQDAHMLCQFFDSEEYKKRVTSFLETQSKLLSKENIAGAKKVQYQHVLSCAQPAHKNVKFCVEPEEKNVIKVNQPKPKKAKKGTIFEYLIKRKNQMEADVFKKPEIIKIVKKDVTPKKLRHRTTIMPIFLKKMKKKQARILEEEENQDLPGLYMQTARKVPLPEDEPEPLYAQILHRSNVYSKGPNTVAKYNPHLAQKAQSSETSQRPSKLESYNIPKKEKKTFKMENLLFKVKKNSSKMEEDPQKPKQCAFRIGQGNASVDFKKDQLSLDVKHPESDNVAFGTSKLENVSYRLSNLNSKVEDVSMKLGGPSQFGQVPLRMSSSTAKGVTAKLFPKKNISMNLKSYSDLLCVEPVHVKASKKKSKKQKKLPGNTVKFEEVKRAEGREEVDNGGLTRGKDVSQQKFMENVHKNRTLELEDNLERKTTMVAVAKKKNVQVKKKRRLQMLSLFAKVKMGTQNTVMRTGQTLCMFSYEIFHLIIFLMISFFCFFITLIRQTSMKNRYLLRLPKSTPEGYRILMYAVRDPDPTKMNFNDVVKGFCMYNDCVLSEDGLQEGYIVIFDMKDVGIGHLARVSLPALKCFMYYIQDAHPCRLKQIHVLNTCSWIHHIMRLVVPLVRSELLSLVRFHKGNVPDNFPVELLPMDYGGEAPTVEDLDRTTKSMLSKYRDWLVESSQLKADESKRTKKASWWGLFSKSPQQNELDEKTILRNLQID